MNQNPRFCFFFFFLSNHRRWKNQNKNLDYVLVLLLFWVSNVDFTPSPSFSFLQLYKHLTRNTMGTGGGWKLRCRGMRCLQKHSQEAKNPRAPVSPGTPPKRPDLVHTCPRGMWFKRNSEIQNRNTPRERACGFDSVELLNNPRDKWPQSPQFIVINFLCAGGLWEVYPLQWPLSTI